MTHEHDDSFTPIRTRKQHEKRGTVRGFLIGVILTAIIATYAHVWFMPEPVVCLAAKSVSVSAELKTLREDLALYKEAARLPHGYITMSTQRLRPPPVPQYKPLGVM